MWWERNKPWQTLSCRVKLTGEKFPKRPARNWLDDEKEGQKRRWMRCSQRDHVHWRKRASHVAPNRLNSLWHPRFKIRTPRGSKLFARLLPLLMILWILHLLTCVAQVTQDAHTVLHRLVIDVVLANGCLDDVKHGFDETLAFPELPACVLAVRTHVPAQNTTLTRDW